MRIALARLLLGPAGQSAASKESGGVLLLDEPTNHLDNAAIKWLGNFLRTSGDSFHRVKLTAHSLPHGRRCPGNQGTATDACSAGLGYSLDDWVYRSG